jgi:subtilase family serine protease
MDSQCTITESNESNNQASLSYTVAAPPDLAVIGDGGSAGTITLGEGKEPKGVTAGGEFRY